MIATYLDLSTGHLTVDTRNLLEQLADTCCNGPGWPALTIASYPHGFFVTVPADAEQEQWDALPADLRGVFDHAIAMYKGEPGTMIQLLRFDSDADEHGDLPTYDE